MIGRLVSLAILAALAVSGAAAAWAQMPESQPPPGRRPTIEKSAAARAAETYSAKGMSLGGFRLFPVLEVDEAYNDNIYATSPSTGTTPSFVQYVVPSVELRSDWSNHKVNLFARGNFSFYSADAAHDFQDFTFGTEDRLDIRRNWTLSGGLQYSRLHEDYGTPNSANGAFSPTIYYLLSGNLKNVQRLGMIKLQVDARVDRFTYLNNGLGAAEGVIPNTDRDRVESREAFKVGYEFIPGYELWLRSAFNQRNYRYTPDSSGYNRDSQGFGLVTGVTIDFGGITAVEMFAGYLQQNYVDYVFPNVSTPTFGLTGYWNPTPPLWVKPFVRRTLEDTSLTNAASFIQTTGGLDLTYDVRPNVRLDLRGDYSTADYLTIASTPGRADQYFSGKVNVLYNLTPEVFTGPSYQYINRTSTSANPYSQNIIMLRLGARL